MQCLPGISSMSLGRAWVHDMQNKLEEAAKHGFSGVEIFYEDLEYLADSSPAGRSQPGLKSAAAAVRSMCDRLNLFIINIQPFSQYEGLRDRSKHDARIEELKFWFEVADILKTDIISIPANFLPESEITGELNVIVSDLQKAADLGAARNPPIRFNYENLCWSTYIDTWEKCWEVVRKVDRDNFGICLDTFNIAGRVYADPTSPSSRTENASIDTAASIQRLVKMIDVRKVFFIQVVDAERLTEPLTKDHPYYVEGQPARMSWSRNCRLFYGEDERGGYLPIKELVKAIINNLEFRGWVSMELFNRSMADADPSVPSEHARRGMAAWAKIKRDTQLSAPTGPAKNIPHGHHSFFMPSASTTNTPRKSLKHS
ncbi:sugar phosphate isomerase [Myriangium duriaei CBS 260.36]|uniref:Sugar phosphate isomerase n=1 Tax=Myriangium duriaei CBS 260.36 TaxID=1168546 RepID=A0A9P4MLA6_9PEZI|nr:sugar phosphate isomerase [Myriangium duriaei CBS 260.36]